MDKDSKSEYEPFLLAGVPSPGMWELSNCPIILAHSLLG